MLRMEKKDSLKPRTQRRNNLVKSVILVFVCSFASALPVFARQTSPAAKPIPDAAQRQRHHEEFRKFLAEHNRLQTQARQAFDAEAARAQTRDCPTAQTTRDFELCYDKESETTEKNYKVFVEAIRNLLSVQPSSERDEPKSGPAGPILTPQQQLTEFDSVESRWQSYRDALCAAEFHQYGGGTGGPVGEIQCSLRLTRSHMREINDAYSMLLHN